MIITDEMRLKLTERAREVFKEDGEILMAHLPVGGIDTLATKHDLHLVKVDLEKELAQFEKRISDQFNKQTWSIIGLFFAINSLFLAVSKWG